MTEPAQPDPRALARRMTEFSPRLSPMLVKELRQGMRTHLFAVAFILLQALMILCLMAGLAEPGSPVADRFLWFFVGITLLAVQPLRGFSALSAEYRLNTMDLIQLTRLNAWRIVLGKWTALNAQGLLFLTGVLPYLVIRYFFGNVDFVTDLVVLLLFGLGSALTTAITVGCSVFRHVLLRAAIAILLGVGLLIFGLYVSSTILTRSSVPDPALIGLLALGALYGCFFFLSFGASRIAPLSENHGTRKRLVAIGAAALCHGFLFLGLDLAVAFVTTAILALACIDALTEPLPVFSRVLPPFSITPLTRLGALFLAPGWIGGLGFFVVAGCLYYGSTMWVGRVAGQDVLHNREQLILFVSTCNVVVFPLLIIHLFFRRYGREHFTFALYVFIQVGVAVVTLMVMSIASMLGRWEETIYMLCPLPSVLVFGASRANVDETAFFALALGTTFLCVMAPLLCHRRDWREFIRWLSPRAASTQAPTQPPAQP